MIGFDQKRLTGVSVYVIALGKSVVTNNCQAGGYLKLGERHCLVVPAAANRRQTAGDCR